MGFVEDLSYGDIVTIDNGISFDEAKIQFRNILKRNLSRFNDFECAYVSSGGINSASNLVFKNGPGINTFGFTGRWSEDLSKYYNTTHYISNFGTIKNDLIEMNKLWKNSPRLGTMGDVFVYNRLKKIRDLGFTIDVCEGGPDWLLLSTIFAYTDIIGLAIKRSDYDIQKSADIINQSRFQKSTSFNLNKSLLVDKKSSYIDTFIKNYGIFTDEEILSLGYTPPKYELRVDNLSHLTQLVNDWLSPNRLTSRSFAESFGIRLDSPYFMSDDMVNFCLSVPVEYRYCHGSKKHLLRESLGSELPTFVLYRDDFNPDINNFNFIIDQLVELDDLYIKPPNLEIYNYFDYNKVGSFTSFKKHWYLINLSIWLEVNKGNV